jgi:predicted dehydrogenase
MTPHDGARAAIIGAGLMGRWHADAVRKIGGRVTLIVDPNEAARDALGRRHPEARLVAELDPALVSRHAAGAHVCTPLSTHASIIAQLVDAGIHALVEKPFTESAESTATLLSLAETRRVVVCPVHQFLFQDGVLRLLEWRTAIAPIRRIEFSTHSAGATHHDPASLDDLIGEILPHPLALVSALLDAALAGSSWQLASPSPGELHALTTVRETVVSIVISAHGRPTENVLRIVGDGGSASVDLFHGYAVRLGKTVSRSAKVMRPFVIAGATARSASANLMRRGLRNEPAYPGLRELISRFYSATLGGASAPIAGAATLDVATARGEILERLRTVRRAAPSATH